MALFKKSAAAKELKTLQTRRESLSRQREQLDAAVAEHERELRDALVEDAAEAAIEAIEIKLDKAKRRLQGVVAALDSVEQQIATAQDEILATARAKAIGEAVAAQQIELTAIRAAVAALVDASAAVATAASAPISANLFSVKELAGLASTLVRELPLVLRRAVADVEFHVDGIEAGVIRPKLPGADVPPPMQALKPIETRRVLSLSALAWPGDTCAKHDQADLPAELATKAIALGLALSMDDPRWRGLYNGGVGKPHPSACIDLTKDDIQAPKPAFGADRYVQQSGMRETLGGARR